VTIPAPDGSLTNLHIGQALPLTIPYVSWDTGAANAIPNATSTVISMASFRMPFYGDVVFQGWIRMVVSQGIQAVNIGVDASSTPAPTQAPWATYRTEGGTGQSIVMMPVLGTWTAVTPATLVTIRLWVDNGTGGPSLQMDNRFGVAYCTKT
jgi:hypothetical protein